MRKILLAIMLTGMFLPAAWGAWLGNYNYQITLTIKHTQVTGPQVNFPVLITEANLPASFFAHVAKSNPTNIDIAFSLDGVTTLSSEVVVFDSTNKLFEAWVRIPALSSAADTTVYMFYGDAAVNNPNDTNTWDAGFAGVWHMQDAAGPILDSTANANSGVTHGNLADPVNAQIQNGQNFNGTSGYVDCGGITGSLDISGATADLTIETWVNFNSLPAVGNYMDFLCKGDRQWSLQKANGNNIGFFINTGGGTWHNVYANNPPSIGTWYHVVGRYTALNNEVAMFINGVKQASTTTAPSINDDGQRVYFGQDSQMANRFLDGVMDEVRIQNVPRSDTWISTTYNNENSPAAFYSAGVENAKATPTFTSTPTNTPTITVSPTITPTFSATPTFTSSSTISPTDTVTPTITPTGTITSTSTVTATITPTSTHSCTFTPSATTTPTFTHSPTYTSTFTITPTSTKTPLFSPTCTFTPTFTLSPSPTVTCTPSITPLRPAAGDLSQVVVYPNPFRADRNGGEKRMVFMGLTPKATIRIYNVTGQLVRTLEKNDSYAVYVWDLNNSQGTAAASGIYLYLIKSDQGEARGKLAILR